MTILKLIFNIVERFFEIFYLKFYKNIQKIFKLG
jgi:hypothetical protein